VSATPSPILESGDFAAGRCAFCEREVLTYATGAGDAVRRCIHCDERIVELRWVDVGDLTALGYAVDSGEPATGCATCTSGTGCATDSTKR